MKVTYFLDEQATNKREADPSFEELIASVVNAPAVAYKAALPWMKLGTYGDHVDNPASGCLRTNANLRTVSGVEVDYDLEEMTLEEAADLIRSRGIKAFLFTTASHRPDAPRWRMLFPLSREAPPQDREAYVRRANGILGGVLSTESFAMSQAFYVGRVAGVVFDYRVTDGRCIDEVAGLPEIGKAGGTATGASGYTREAAYDEIASGENLHAPCNYLIMRGEPREAIEAALHESAAKTNTPQRWEKAFKDLDRSIRGAERRRERDTQKYLAGVGAPPRYSSDTPAPRASVFETITAASLAGQPVPEQAWLARDLIPAGQPVLLSGDGGLGKSLLTLQLAVAVASGGQWLGDYVQQGAALYLSAEDEIAEIHRRLSRITGKLDTLANLHIAPMAELDTLLVAPVDRNRLATTALYDAVAARVEEIRPALVVLDSAADYFGGNEVVRSDVRWFIGQLRKLCHATGCTLLILSHPSVSGMATGSGLSGSTHWNNSVRGRLYLTRPSGEDGDRDERVLEVMKNNRGPLGKRVVMRWQAGAFVAVDNSETGDASAEADAVFLELLTSYTSQRRYVNAAGGPSYAPTLFAKDEIARKRHITKSALVAAMNRLLRQNRIAVETRKSSGHERSYLTVSEPR